MNFLETIQRQPEIWLAIGLVLIISEMFTSSFIAFFFGFAAIVTSILLFLGLIKNNSSALFIFAVTGLISTVLFRKIAKTRFQSLSANTVNINPGFEDIVGMQAKVIVEFTGSSITFGKVEMRGTQWDAVSNQSLKIGENVIVESIQNNQLIIKRNN